jgi:hypothetical protein
MSEILVSVGTAMLPYVIQAGAALVSAGVAWVAGRYLKDKAWAQRLIVGATATAVAQVEEQFVKPLKAGPEPTPGGNLTTLQGLQAKRKAEDIAMQFIRTVGTGAAPHVIASIPGEIGAAIESAVRKLKPATGADLPGSVKAGLPD